MMGRTIYAVKLTLYKIDLEPNRTGEGERIVNKASIESHYDGSRTPDSARKAFDAANAALKATA